MAVTSSPGFPDISNMCRTKRCRSCGLFIHQKPIYDNRLPASVFWVGLSAVRFGVGEKKLPLSPLTPSGALIESIELPYRDHTQFYKTNIVKCVPMQDDRIRYPLAHEMEKCFPNFEWELEHLKPQTIFLLGKQVADFVCKKLTGRPAASIHGFEFQPVQWNGLELIPVHHPSYILVYKRKLVGSYIKNIQDLLPGQSVRTVAC